MFTENTKNVYFSQTQNEFMELLPRGGAILDFGCGSGHDTKCFLDHGFCVEATDGSEELCRLASDYTGIIVRHMLFIVYDKRLIMHYLLDEVQIWKECQSNGLWIKSLRFKVPLDIDGELLDTIEVGSPDDDVLPNENHDETCPCYAKINKMYPTVN